MGIHYDYKSTRGEKALKKEAKRKARIEQRRAKKKKDMPIKEKEEKLKKLDSIRGEQVEAGWGRQIRSYVMQPYQQVKDSRTNIEVGNIQSVLDGDINIFINEYLKWRRQGLND